MPRQRESKRWKKFINQSFLLNATSWRADTAHLTHAETSIYINLLTYQWDNNGIPDDLKEIHKIAGKQLPFTNEDLHNILSSFTIIDMRESTFLHAILSGDIQAIRDAVCNSPGSLLSQNMLAKLTYQSFLECWDTLKKYFNKSESGLLVNYRLEQERLAKSQYQQSQADRTQKARDKNLINKKNRSVTDPVTEHQPGLSQNTNTQMTDLVTEHQPGLSIGKTGAVTALSINTVLIQNTHNPSIVSPNLNSKKIEQPAPTPGEKSVSQAVSRSLLAHLPPFDDKYHLVCQQALKSYEDKFLMHSKMYGRPDELQVFLLTQYFYDTGNLPGDTTPAMLMRQWVVWLNINADRLERQYNNISKDIHWFNIEMANANGIIKEKASRAKFIAFYTAKQPSGKMYFQTLANFTIQEYADRWNKTEFKQIRKVELKIKGEVLPKEGMSQDELLNFYKTE